MRFGNSLGRGSRICKHNTNTMKITDTEIQALQNLLNGFESQNGSLTVETMHTTNCYQCTGSCNNFCTGSCRSYCDGNSGSCWNTWRG